MIDEIGIASGDDGLGTHASTCATCTCVAFVRQYLGREYAEELFLRIRIRFSEALAYKAGQRTPIHLPKLGNLDLGRIHFECGPHGRE